MSRAGDTTPRPGLQKAGIVGSVMVMMGALTALLSTWEGKRNDPYLDSVGVRTVCYGETRVEMRRYSDGECRLMLEEGAAGFAEAVRKRNPNIAQHPYQWAAHTSLAYNIGIAAYNRSSVARLFEEGKHHKACEFIGKFRMAGGRVMRGLVLRRQGDATRIGEVEVCLKGISPSPVAR